MMRFVFVDRIVSIEKGVCASMLKNVSASEDYFSAHFPDFPIVPGALMLEALEQASAILIAFCVDFKASARLKRVRNAKFRRIVRPGDQMVLDVRLESLDERAAQVAGKIRVEERNTATAHLLFSLFGHGDAAVPGETAKLESLYRILTRDVHAVFS